MKNKKKSGLLGAGAVALIASAAVFVLMLTAQKRVLAQYEKVPALVAAVAIPKGTLLTRENAAAYLTQKEAESSLVPASALLEIPEEGLFSVYGIEEGTILSAGMFSSPREALAAYPEPVLVGFRAEDLSQVAGGVIRPGDRIHIYLQEEETGKVFLYRENLYVAECFDSAGKPVSSASENGTAVRFNVYLDRGDVESFLQGLHPKTLRVVKVCG